MNGLPPVLDVVLSFLVIAGALFSLIGSWGLVRFGDFLKRLHGPTKASTVGLGAVLLASIGFFAARGQASLHELLITVFVFMTAPVAAHLLVKAAMHMDARLRPPPPPPFDRPSDGR
jgi:multicomponent K+:H+ antiporter subunit G